MPEYKYKRQDKRIESSECELMFFEMPSLKFRSLLSLLYITGARISELLRLTPKNIIIDKKENTIKILVASLKRGKSKKGSIEARPLIFNLKTHFMNHFLEHYNQDKKEKILYEGITRFMIWYYIKKSNKFCSPHMFRHSRLQKLADGGATAYQIRSFAGHSKLDSSLAYIQASEFTLKPLKDLIS